MAKKKYPSKLETGESPAKDNLQLITGVGPAVEKRLNDIGISTFPQLAALSPADIAAAIADLSGLSAERVIKQDWIGQARRLAAGEAEPEQDTGNAIIDEPLTSMEHALSAPVLPESEMDVVPPTQQYRLATFTVEFLLGENNNVDSTHVVHSQSGRQQTWAGWQMMQLVDFMSESVGLDARSDQLAMPLAEESVNAQEAEIVTNEKLTLVADEITGSTPSVQPVSMSMLSGVLRLRELEVMGAKAGSFRRTLAQNEPFDVRLTLDLSELEVPENTPLNYKASIYGKGNRSGLLIGETQGTVMPTDTVTIKVERNMLPEEGIYQLAARVIAGLPTMELRARSGITAIIDGGQVQVF